MPRNSIGSVAPQILVDATLCAADRQHIRERSTPVNRAAGMTYKLAGYVCRHKVAYPAAHILTASVTRRG
jgi:hypothetical protein